MLTHVRVSNVMYAPADARPDAVCSQLQELCYYAAHYSIISLIRLNRIIFQFALYIISKYASRLLRKARAPNLSG